MSRYDEIEELKRKTHDLEILVKCLQRDLKAQDDFMVYKIRDYFENHILIQRIGKECYTASPKRCPSCHCLKGKIKIEGHIWEE